MSNEMTAIEQMQPLSVAQIKAQVQTIQQVMEGVMLDGTHYGKIPGCGDKPALLKAGAEKLCMTFRLDPEYEINQEREDGHLTITSKCTLHYIPNGARMGSGHGSCSTRESKYAYRTGARRCPSCGAEAIIKGKSEYGGGWLCYGKKGGCGQKFEDKDPAIVGQAIGRIPNEDLADQFNTVLKMANKRALVAAVLNVTAASDIFEQDIDDMDPEDLQREESKPEKKVDQPQAKSRNKVPDNIVSGNGDVYDNRGAPKDAGQSQDKRPGDAQIMDGPLRLIRAKLAQSGITDTELCAHFKVENLEDLEMLHVNAAIRFAQNGPA